MKQHKTTVYRRLLWILIVSLGLMGCQPTPVPPTPAKTLHPTSVAETRTPFPTWTQTATPLPATPFPTPAATATLQPTATATPLPVCAPIWQRPLSKTEPLPALILFTSTVHAPFAPGPAGPNRLTHGGPRLRGCHGHPDSSGWPCLACGHGLGRCRQTASPPPETVAPLIQAVGE